jgi:LPPG:FO 2-phospho-L-lactate transferase
VTSPSSPRPLLALSGGTGGAKLLDGLARAVGQEDLCAVVNTGDDGDFYGLRVCPDLDICCYTLAGVVSERGWGYVEDSFRCLEGLATYGRPAWFNLGDRDLATHIHRTLRLGEGWTLSQVTAELCGRLGVAARVLPMSDDPIRTRITTPHGVLSFQEYLVQRGARDQITRIELVGIADARPAPGLVDQIAAAERIVICPSSPVVSIGTILAVPGVREALAARRERVVAVSPIVGKRPVEGPADRFLAGAGYPECTATQMARIYADVAATFVLDARDADEAPAIAALDVRPVLLDALMPDREARLRLAGETLAALEAGG